MSFQVQLQTQQMTSPYKNTWDAIKNVGQHGMVSKFDVALNLHMYVNFCAVAV